MGVRRGSEVKRPAGNPLLSPSGCGSGAKRNFILSHTTEEEEGIIAWISEFSYADSKVLMDCSVHTLNRHTVRSWKTSRIHLLIINLGYFDVFSLVQVRSELMATVL